MIAKSTWFEDDADRSRRMIVEGRARQSESAPGWAWALTSGWAVASLVGLWFLAPNPLFSAICRAIRRS